MTFYFYKPENFKLDEKLLDYFLNLNIKYYD